MYYMLCVSAGKEAVVRRVVALLGSGSRGGWCQTGARRGGSAGSRRTYLQRAQQVAWGRARHFAPRGRASGAVASAVGGPRLARLLQHGRFVTALDIIP